VRARSLKSRTSFIPVAIAVRAWPTTGSDEFRLTWLQFCPTPGAKPRQFRPTTMRQPATRNRLARDAWATEMTPKE
jgi:hypothetical protein